MLERTMAAMRGTVRSTPSGSGGERPGAIRSKQLELRDHRVPIGQVSRVFREVYEAERLSAGTVPLHRRPEPIRELADAAIQRLAHSAGVRALRVENAVHQDLVAPCDRDRILKVLLHLLANAISASNERGKVVIDGRSVENGIVVSVRDEGAGIDPRAWPYLFSEGWRDPSRKGDGLGLTVSQAIVRAHGGKIWCESSLGQGTTFRFVLPTAPAGHAEAPKAPDPTAIDDSV